MLRIYFENSNLFLFSYFFLLFFGLFTTLFSHYRYVFYEYYFYFYKYIDFFFFFFFRQTCRYSLSVDMREWLKFFHLKILNLYVISTRNKYNDGVSFSVIKWCIKIDHLSGIRYFSVLHIRNHFSFS